MKLTDFEYAGEKLSAKGCMVCTWDSSGDESRTLGGNLTFTTVRNNNSNVQRKVSTTYDNPYAPEQISICKVNCYGDPSQSYWSEEEIRSFMKWLNRKSYEKLRPIYDKVYNGTYFKCSCNVSAHEFGGNVIGLDLTFTTNAPFGFADKSADTYTITGGTNITVHSESDEIGFIYPKIIITMQEAGDLVITNSNETKEAYKKTIIKNCAYNEVITFSGESKMIYTNLKAHATLPRDFNYVYPRLHTTYSSDATVFNFSLPCTAKFEYAPIRKVGIL